MKYACVYLPMCDYLYEWGICYTLFQTMSLLLFTAAHATQACLQVSSDFTVSVSHIPFAVIGLN